MISYLDIYYDLQYNLDMANGETGRTGFTKMTSLINKFIVVNGGTKSQASHLFNDDIHNWSLVSKFNNTYVRPESETRCKGITLHDLPCSTKAPTKDLCVEKTNGLCYMHCNCDYCGEAHPTKQQGRLFTDSQFKGPMLNNYSKVIETKNLPVFQLEVLWKETDIDKLKCLVEAISRDVPLQNYFTEAKRLYKNIGTKKLIEELEIQLKELKETIV